MSEHGDLQERVLILAPIGRAGPLAAQAIDQAGLSTQACICADMAEFVAKLERGAAAGVLTEEALAPRSRTLLRAALDKQPLWSDFPLIVCAGGAETAAGRRRMAALAAELGNATLLERPIHPETLVGSVRSALRARRRQYQARALLGELQTAVRQREHFLATLSHELRNPLGAIRNGVQLLSGRLPPGSGAETPLAIIERQSRHLGRLVDDLLDVARVTTGKVALRRQVVDLRAVLESVCQAAQPMIEQQGLTLERSLLPSPCPVDGDPVRLEQIFSNLVTNAVKYTPRGGQVTISLGLDAGGNAQVRVADSGVGMSPETLPKIFDLFSQADRSLHRSQGGMGIGLTLVQALTLLHGGTVTASSGGLGRGSEFTVALPVAERVPAPSAADAPGPPPRRHILIVEDSADNRETLQALLEYEGHRVEVASDGLEAIQAAARSHPDVALIDIGLPGIDGYEVARRMRSGLGADIVLVALTGYGRPEDRQRSLEAGFDSHLTKPPDLSELNALLARKAASQARACP
jgi:signal transduction histidine kinase/CheY-like chemotaxis protein